MIKNEYTVHPDGYLIVRVSDEYSTYIDSVDLPILYERKWYLDKNKMNVMYSDTHNTLYMHRAIMDSIQEISLGMVVSHRNGDPLDNRRDNLYICTVQASNSVRTDNKCGIKGVFFDKTRGRWIAKITRNGKTKRRTFIYLEDTISWRRQEEMNI